MRVSGQKIVTPKMGFHRGTGQFRVTLGGKSHYLGTDTAEAEIRYKRLVAEFLARGAMPAPPPVDDLRVCELVDRYLKWAEVYYRRRPKNIERIEIAFKPVLELYADERVATFSPAQFKAARHRMITVHKWARGYVNTCASVVRRAFKWAVAEGMADVAVFQRLSCVEGLRRGFTEARETPPRQGATRADIDAIRHRLPAPVAAALDIIYLTGARPSEVLNLRVRDINRADAEIWRADVAEHKTKHLDKPRVLFFGKQAQAVLRPFLLKSPDAFLFDPRESMAAMRDRRNAERATPDNCGNCRGSNVKKAPKVNPGECYTVASFRRCLDRAIQAENTARTKKGEAPLAAWSPYCLRHGRAIELREKIGLDAVQSVLGHANVRISEHYGKLTEAVARNAAALLG